MRSRASWPRWRRRRLILPLPNRSSRNRRSSQTSPRPPRDEYPISLMLSLSKHEASPFDRLRVRPFLSAVGAIAFFLLASAAFAANGKTEGTGLGGSGEAILIAEIALLLFVGRGLGELMQRIGQPAVIGQLLAGLILGPSFFGWLWPGAHYFLFPDTPAQKSLIAGLSNVG